MTRKDIPERIDFRFREEMDDIIIGRMKIDMDRRPKTIRRITAAIRRHPSFPKIKEDIILSDLKEELD